MKDNNNIKIIKHKQKVLVGSSSLSFYDQKNHDRTAFMVENMSHNKAYLYALKGDINADKDKLLNTFQERYKKYRHSWHEQPKR